jgi:hypothetical protein
MEEIGAWIMSTGPVWKAEAKEIRIEWRNKFKRNLYVREAHLYISGVFNGYQDIYAYASVGENVMVAGELAAYSNSKQDRIVLQDFRPNYYLVPADGVVTLTYFCLLVSGEMYNGIVPQGCQINLWAWFTKDASPTLTSVKGPPIKLPKPKPAPVRRFHG